MRCRNRAVDVDRGNGSGDLCTHCGGPDRTVRGGTAATEQREINVARHAD